MKNFTRKLLVSIIAVAFAFVAMGTSTYAWFTMNKEVTASGMEITAKSDNVYLIIGNSTLNTVELLEKNDRTAADKKAATVTTADPSVYPTAHEKTATTPTALATVANWYTMEAEKDSAAKGDETTKAALSAFEDYVIVNTFYMTLSTGSVESGALTVDLTDDSAVIDVENDENVDTQTVEAIRVAIAATYADEDKTVKVIEGSLKVNDEEKLTIEWDDDNTLLDSMVEATLLKVEIYIYLDGNNDLVYVQNVKNLAGAALNFKFDVE